MENMMNITIGLHPPDYYPKKLMDIGDYGGLKEINKNKHNRNGVSQCNIPQMSSKHASVSSSADNNFAGHTSSLPSTHFNITIGCVPPTVTSPAQLTECNSYEFNLKNLSSMSSYDYSHICVDENPQLSPGNLNSPSYAESSNKHTGCNNSNGITEGTSKADANADSQTDADKIPDTTKSKKDLMEICMAKMKVVKNLISIANKSNFIEKLFDQDDGNIECSYVPRSNDCSKTFNDDNHQASLSSNAHSSCYDGNNIIQRHKSKSTLCRPCNSKLLKINDKYDELSKRLEKLECSAKDFNGEKRFNDYVKTYDSLCLVRGRLSPKSGKTTKTPQLWVKGDHTIADSLDVSKNAIQYPTLWALITFPTHKIVGSGDIHNILDAHSKLTYKIYLSKELEADENDLILELRDMPYHWNSRKVWKRYIKDNKLYADGTRQTRLEYLIDYFTHPNHRRRRPSLKILLPSHLLDGSCIYLTIMAYNDSELYNVYKKRLSHLMVPNTKDLTKRYLLDNNSNTPDLGLLENVMIKHIPHTIQFGPVIEYRSTNIKDAVKYRSNLLKYIDGKKYKLPIYYNDLIVPRDEYVPISSYCSESNGYKIDQDQKIYLNLVYQPISYEKYLFHKIIKSILVNMEENININTYDTDSLMLMATDTSPYLIAMAYIIAILHLSLEIISLSSEIKFWKYHVEPEKLSTTSIWIDSLFQIIILLYLNHIGKSKLVIGVVAFQTLFNFYKLSKLRIYQFYIEYSGVLPVPFKLERYGSDKMFKTELDEFESVQVKRLYMFAFLFVLVYCAYTLAYVKHQSWSSWIISSLAVCSYTGGFLSMTPQLFRNYYLKSVEHMPWDTLIYKFINTIIDDFFSFIIRMPQMHRVSVFRDDVVFFVYAIQTIIYKTKAHAN